MRPLPAGEPWGDYAVLDSSLEGSAASRGDRASQAARHRSRGAVRRRGSRVIHPGPRAEGHRASDLFFERSLTLVHAARSRFRDPDCLRDQRRAAQPRSRRPVRLIVPHWYGASVKWLKRIEVLGNQAIHRRVRNRALHVPVGRSAARARDGDAAARSHHRSRAGQPRSTAARSTSSAGRRASGTGPVTIRHQPDGRIRVASGPPGNAERPVPMAELVVRMGTHRSGAQEPPRTCYRCRRERPAGSPYLEQAGLWQQRHRSHLRRRAMRPAGPSESRQVVRDRAPEAPASGGVRREDWAEVRTRRGTAKTPVECGIQIQSAWFSRM